MSASIDERSRALLNEKNFAHVATVGENGLPHVAVSWIDVGEGDEIWLNSAEGRVWPENLRREPRLTITVVNHENPYEYVSIRGRAAEITGEGADEHIDALAKKYLDADSYPFRQDGEVRLKIRVEPEKVAVRGG